MEFLPAPYGNVRGIPIIPIIRLRALCYLATSLNAQYGPLVVIPLGVMKPPSGDDNSSGCKD